MTDAPCSQREPMCMRDTCTLYTNVCLCVRAGIQLHREALGPVSISTGRDVPRKQSKASPSPPHSACLQWGVAVGVLVGDR